MFFFLTYVIAEVKLPSTHTHTNSREPLRIHFFGKAYVSQGNKYKYLNLSTSNQEQANSQYLSTMTGVDYQIMQDSPTSTLSYLYVPIRHIPHITFTNFAQVLILGLRFTVVSHRTVLATALYLLQI